MATNCALDEFPPSLFGDEECVKHGFCDNETLWCVCDPGWTGESHWISAAGQDCHVNILAEQLLWTLPLLAFTFVFVKYFRRFRQQMRRFQARQTVAIAHGKRPKSILKHTTFPSTMLYFFVVSPVCVCMCILMISSPTSQHIARDWPATLLWFVGRTAFYGGGSLYQTRLVQVTLGRSVSVSFHRSFSVRPRKVYQFVFGSHVFWGLLAFLPLMAGSDDDDRGRLSLVTWVLCMGGTSVTLMVTAGQAIFLRRKLSAHLDASYAYFKHDGIKVTRGRMWDMQTTIVRASLLHVLVYLPFACVPQLFASYDYMAGLSWLSIPMVGISLMESLLIESREVDKGSVINDAKRLENGETLGESVLTQGTVLSIHTAHDPNLLATTTFNGATPAPPAAAAASRTSGWWNSRSSTRGARTSGWFASRSSKRATLKSNFGEMLRKGTAPAATGPGRNKKEKKKKQKKKKKHNHKINISALGKVGSFFFPLNNGDNGDNGDGETVERLSLGAPVTGPAAGRPGPGPPQHDLDEEDNEDVSQGPSGAFETVRSGDSQTFQSKNTNATEEDAPSEAPAETLVLPPSLSRATTGTPDDPEESGPNLDV